MPTATRRTPDLALPLSPPAEVTPEALSAVDETWFDMDRPHNPMVVASVLEFDRVDDIADLARDILQRLLSQPRFRQRIDPVGGRRAWVEDELRLGYHLRVRTLGDPRSEEELRAAIAKELEQDLDRARPLWRIVFYPRGARRVTALFRAHHAMADGVALMQLLLRVASEAEPAAPAGAPAPPHAHPHGPLTGLIARLEGVNDLLDTAAHEIIKDLEDPARLRSQVAEARRVLGAAARVAALPDDNPAAFRIPLSGRRAVAWNHALSFDLVRRIARKQHVKVNDVFLTALSGAFGRYLRGSGAEVREGQNLRVSVPVNLRPAGDGSLGNCFGLVLVDLPIGLEGWHARLDVVADRMSALKRSPEPRTVLMALAAAGHLPAAAERQLVNFVAGKAAAVVSNLPGPTEGLTFGAARLRNMVFWPPQSAGVGIGVSLLSYAGHVSIGVSADRAQLADPVRLIEHFHAEIEAMLGRGPRLTQVNAPAAHPRNLKSFAKEQKP